MNRSHVLVLCFGLLGGAILYSLATGGSPENSAGSLSPTAQAADEGFEPIDRAVVQAEPARLEVESPAPEADVVHEDEADASLADEIPETGSSNYGHLPWDDYPGDYQELLQVPKSVWEEKYAGFSEMELTIAKGSIRAQFFKTAGDVIEERRLAGLSTVFPAKSKTTPSGEEKRIPFKLKKSGNIPIHSVTAYPATEDREAYIEFIWLPPDEYPDFYLLSSEAMWLGKQTPD